MFKYAVVFCFFVAAVYANDVIEPSEAVNEEAPAARFFASTTTTTVYVVTSTVAVSSVTRTCASASNVSSVCRRRRGIEERPILLALDDDVDVDAILPAEPIAVEATEAAEIDRDPGYGVKPPPKTPEIDPSTDMVEVDIFVPSTDMVEVDIFGLDNSCGQQRFLINGVTIRYTTTATVTSTSYLPVTVATKTYVVVGCTPSGFATNLC